ncbi:hypothetical protein VUR80DRAFT_1859 [Thermomyces stellatus]
MATSLTKPLTLPGPYSTSLPRLIYGTAWKKERTNPLVHLALTTGFRALDTAAQPRHYAEHHVASALRLANIQHVVSRSDVFLQTKFSPPSAQDLETAPYDVQAPIAEQVRTSVEASLRKFTLGDEAGDGGGYIDCLLLHSPLPSLEETIEAWTAMAAFVPHRVRHLGISNVSLPVLRALCDTQGSGSTLPKPAVVQNRILPGAYEPDLYEFCRERGIVFQAFWTLSANPNLRESKPVGRVAEETGVSRPVAMYALLLGFENFAVLDGTTSQDHMKEDLEGLEKVGRWMDGEGKQVWVECLKEFKELMGCQP